MQNVLTSNWKLMHFSKAEAWFLGLRWDVKHENHDKWRSKFARRSISFILLGLIRYMIYPDGNRDASTT